MPPLPRNTATTLHVGDASYVLPGTRGSLANEGVQALTLWVVAVVPSGAAPSAPAAP